MLYHPILMPNDFAISILGISDNVNEITSYKNHKANIEGKIQKLILDAVEQGEEPFDLAYNFIQEPYQGSKDLENEGLADLTYYILDSQLFTPLFTNLRDNWEVMLSQDIASANSLDYRPSIMQGGVNSLDAKQIIVETSLRVLLEKLSSYKELIGEE